jgi:flavin reductase (DIM6/NTAB) family NADH-FMN oxidoreductase RutF
MDTRTYFDIMGTAPASVTVVTTLDATGQPRGLTVAAVTSVSADPPILLVSIDRRSRTLPTIRQHGAFAVNFLRGDRAEVAARFASPLADRFAGIGWGPGATGVPVLVEDSLSHAECVTIHERLVGDHMVLFGHVLAGAPPPVRSRPLLYFRHRYASWQGHVDDGTDLDAGLRHGQEIGRALRAGPS